MRDNRAKSHNDLKIPECLGGRLNRLDKSGGPAAQGVWMRTLEEQGMFPLLPSKC